MPPKISLAELYTLKDKKERISNDYNARMER